MNTAHDTTKTINALDERKERRNVSCCIFGKGSSCCRLLLFLPTKPEEMNKEAIFFRVFSLSKVCRIDIQGQKTNISFSQFFQSIQPRLVPYPTVSHLSSHNPEKVYANPSCKNLRVIDHRMHSTLNKREPPVRAHPEYLIFLLNG